MKMQLAIENNKKEAIREAIKEALFYASLVGIVVCAYLFHKYVMYFPQISGESMMETLHDSEYVVCERVHNFTKIERYDIVTFQLDDGRQAIKRVIGLPGETIRIGADGVIYINGSALVENYGKEVMEFAGVAEEEIVLRKDEYFVLGDNRNKSMDSRYAEIGNIARSRLLGKAICYKDHRNR